MHKQFIIQLEQNPLAYPLLYSKPLQCVTPSQSLLQARVWLQEEQAVLVEPQDYEEEEGEED